MTPGETWYVNVADARIRRRATASGAAPTSATSPYEFWKPPAAPDPAARQHSRIAEAPRRGASLLRARRRRGQSARHRPAFRTTIPKPRTPPHAIARKPHPAVQALPRALRRFLAAAAVAAAFALPAPAAMRGATASSSTRSSCSAATSRSASRTSMPRCCASRKRTARTFRPSAQARARADRPDADDASSSPTRRRRKASTRTRCSPGASSSSRTRSSPRPTSNDVEAAARTRVRRQARDESRPPRARSTSSDKAKYSKPETVMISQLTFRFDGAPEIAKARADDAYAKIKARRRYRRPRRSRFADKLPAASGAASRARSRAPISIPSSSALVFGTAKVGEVESAGAHAEELDDRPRERADPAVELSFEEARTSIVEPMQRRVRAARARRGARRARRRQDARRERARRSRRCARRLAQVTDAGLPALRCAAKFLLSFEDDRAP